MVVLLVAARVLPHGVTTQRTIWRKDVNERIRGILPQNGYPMSLELYSIA